VRQIGSSFERRSGAACMPPVTLNVLSKNSVVKIQSVINCILIAAVTLLLVDRFSSNVEEHPLESEVQLIQKEFYLHYLATGSYPKERSFLSKHSSNIIAAYPDQFRWDEKDVFLHFTPKIPVKFALSTIGMPGETFEHNCKVYLAHAKWSKGFREDYDASEEELKKAGVAVKGQ